jgi:hypothetical protein
VREVPRCQGVGRTLSGSCAMPGCCPGRTRVSHRATVQTSLSRYVTFELPEQAPPSLTRSAGWPAAEFVDTLQPGDRVAKPDRPGPAGQPIRSLTGDREREASSTRRDRSVRGAVALVRAGSARHREPLVLVGHERSRRVWRTAGPSSFAARTTAAGVPRRRVRIPPHHCAGRVLSPAGMEVRKTPKRGNALSVIAATFGGLLASAGNRRRSGVRERRLCWWA